jgi:hypothetical protein
LRLGILQDVAFVGNDTSPLHVGQNLGGGFLLLFAFGLVVVRVVILLGAIDLAGDVGSNGLVCGEDHIVLGKLGRGDAFGRAVIGVEGQVAVNDVVLDLLFPIA